MISTSLIKKWMNMFLHRSVLHVNQSEGCFFSKDTLQGYYNNLTGKVECTKIFDDCGIPLNIAAYGEKKKRVYFPIAIFQYGLGAYDLYLKTGEEAYLERTRRMADWAIGNQETNGAWNTFGILNYANPYSSMAQGEGISLLLRVYKENGEKKYLTSAILAAEFMMKSVEAGGTAVYEKDRLILMEYPAGKCVLNGWIFSSFGLYDLWLTTGERQYHEKWEASLKGIKEALDSFEAGHWTYYDLGKKYASPFYHTLHIELLKALDELDEDPKFEYCIMRWTGFRDHWFWRKKAFAVKAFQKLNEPRKKEWVLTE